MNRKRQRRKQLQGKLHGWCTRRSTLAWILCVALVLGGIWVPETGMAVRAEESGKMTMQTAEAEETPVQAEEPEEMFMEVSAEDFAEEYYPLEENDSSEGYASSWDATDVSGGDSVSEDGATLKPMLLNSAEDDIASGSYGDITWRIDAEGKLMVEGTGEFSDSAGANRAPWYSDRGKIKSAVVHVTGMQDASYMFDDCWGLTSLDVSGFDTSSVTSMRGMLTAAAV